MTTALVKQENAQIAALQQIATQSTPANEIRTRTGRGGTFKYTDGAYVIRTLNTAFGWDWDFVADNEELLMNNGVPFEVKVRGMLTVRMGDKSVTKTQFGSQPIEMMKNGSAPVSIGDCYKGAATDALKKCASMLGIALDLYDSDSAVNTGKIPPPPTPPPAPKPAETRPDLTREQSEFFRLQKKLKISDSGMLSRLKEKFGVDGKNMGLMEAVVSLLPSELATVVNALKEKAGEKATVDTSPV